METTLYIEQKQYILSTRSAKNCLDYFGVSVTYLNHFYLKPFNFSILMYILAEICGFYCKHRHFLFYILL